MIRIEVESNVTAEMVSPWTQSDLTTKSNVIEMRVESRGKAVSTTGVDILGRLKGMARERID